VARLFLGRQKNAAIPAIRDQVNAEIIPFLAVFRRSYAVSPRFLCQGPLFHFDEKTALER
jgi:hypothetical protein